MEICVWLIAQSFMSNLADDSFLNGHSMIEMQAILIELLEHLEFSPAPGNIEIIRGAAGIMRPM